MTQILPHAPLTTKRKSFFISLVFQLNFLSAINEDDRAMSQNVMKYEKPRTTEAFINK